MWQLVLHGRSKFCGAWGRGGHHAQRHTKSGADVAAAARSAQILLLRKQVPPRRLPSIWYLVGTQYYTVVLLPKSRRPL